MLNLSSARFLLALTLMSVEPTSAPVDSSPVVSVTEVARQVGNTYRLLHDLSYELVVHKGGVDAEGKIFPVEEKIRAQVLMSGRKLNLQVTVAGIKKYSKINDGQFTVEWNAEMEQHVRYAQLKPGDLGYGSMKLEQGVEGCLIGTSLESWVDDAERISWFEKKIAAGQYTGIDEVEEHPCLVVHWSEITPGLQESSQDLVEHVYYIDRDSFQIRRWDTIQQTSLLSDKILERVERKRFYLNISTTKITEDAFKAEVMNSEPSTSK
ncbi:MAG: hypothetical protein HJJLKODD_02382 [Phycisphaerae bacterium]|nr:hypothetical protein [Phycisphaerae bacterium]